MYFERFQNVWNTEVCLFVHFQKILYVFISYFKKLTLLIVLICIRVLEDVLVNMCTCTV